MLLAWGEVLTGKVTSRGAGRGRPRELWSCCPALPPGCLLQNLRPYPEATRVSTWCLPTHSDLLGKAPRTFPPSVLPAPTPAPRHPGRLRHCLPPSLWTILGIHGPMWGSWAATRTWAKASDLRPTPPSLDRRGWTSTSSSPLSHLCESLYSKGGGGVPDSPLTFLRSHLPRAESPGGTGTSSSLFPHILQVLVFFCF